MRDKILSMTAGRELDALVAEVVMGWERDFQCWKDENGRIRTIEPTSYGSFQPSTDISAAWEVLEKVQNDWSWEMHMNNQAGEVEVRIGAHWVVKKSVSESICKAAILALEDTNTATANAE